MSSVDLGFLENCEAWQVESYLFPSKLGGKPAWLNLEKLPQPEDLQCNNCKQPMIFLCQIYAPYEEDDSNFHRTLFVFICRNGNCCIRNRSDNIKVFRNSLERRNKFYSYEPPCDEKQDKNFTVTKWLQLCNVCGCLSNKHCAKCKQVAYCSREHQLIDWKEGHKIECCEKSNNNQQRTSSKLFPQYEIVIEAEQMENKHVDEKQELEKFKEMDLKGQTGTMQDISEAEIEQHANIDTDKTFSRFKKRIEDSPDQILRYCRGGQPLWIANEPKPENVPNCETCGGPRQFEFQIMPQLLSVLNEHDLDWGILVVYTCKMSCKTDGKYVPEFVFKQDVAINSII